MLAPKAPAGTDFEAAGPDFEAAGPDFEAAGPDFEAAGPDSAADFCHKRSRSIWTGVLHRISLRIFLEGFNPLTYRGF